MTAESATPALYPIRVVSRLTGLGIDTLRAWERRYGAVTPTRDDRGRLYAESDIARLRLLHQAVSSGHSIGRIATLSDGELRRLAAPEATGTAPPVTRGALDTSAVKAALLKLDGVGIDHEFSRLAAVLPPVELVRDVLLPAIQDVGDVWHEKRGGIAHEHLVTSTLRSLLGSFLRLYSQRDRDVRLLFATLSGDRHEIGLLGAAMLAASSGLGVSYLGPDLPSDEIVAAVRSADARVLVLGLTYLDDAKRRQRDLRAIVRGLPPSAELWVGGSGAARWSRILGRRGLYLPTFDAYLLQLARLGGRAG